MCVPEPGQRMRLSEGLSLSLAAPREATWKLLPAGSLAVPASLAALVFLHDATATDLGSQVSAVKLTSCCRSA